MSIDNKLPHASARGFVERQTSVSSPTRIVPPGLVSPFLIILCIVEARRQADVESLRSQRFDCSSCLSHDGIVVGSTVELGWLSKPLPDLSTGSPSPKENSKIAARSGNSSHFNLLSLAFKI